MIKKVLYGIGILLFFFIGLNKFLAARGSSLDALSSSFMYPFLVMQRAIIHPVEVWWYTRVSYTELLGLLEKYINRTEDLQKQVIELQSTLDYYSQTEEVQRFKERYKTDKAVLAQVLFKSFGERAHKAQASDTTEPLHFFLLDAGENKGITSDMFVAYKNCLVGRISEVYPYYSKVILITDALCKVAAYCAKTGVQGIHEGAYRTDATQLTFVNHLKIIEEGDLVISSGEGLMFPRGFGLGYIRTCKPEGFSHTILVKPLVDLSSITYCFIMHKGAECKEEEAKEKKNDLSLPPPPTEIPLKS
jgi:cell shape-determining protein MreC